MSKASITTPVKTIVKTEWDFSHLYAGIKDPKIEKDLLRIKGLYLAFAKKYKDKKFIANAGSLFSALKDMESLTEKASPLCLWYLELQKSLDSSNTELQAKLTRLTDIYTKAAKEIIFFSTTISKVDVKKQAIFLKDKRLSKYKYLLKVAFDEGKHTLTDAEEKILAEKYAVAHEAWVNMQDKYENAQMVKHGKKMIPLSEAMNIKSNLPRGQRRALHKETMETYKKISFVAEAELNAVIRNWKIDCDLRGYTKPYEATVMHYQNNLKSIENLVDVVTKSNHISHKFFALKAKILNKAEKSESKKITMADINTSIMNASSAHKNISFEETVRIIRESFHEAGSEFAEIFDRYIREGQIDAFPRKGKHNGGFCSSISGSKKTYILMNHVGKLQDVITLAHEMGHAIHSDLSKVQPAIYQDYTISVAEVASTFFENILFDKLLEKATPDEKRNLLLNDLQGRVMSVHAQIAYFQYEKKLHSAIQEKGYISNEEMASMFADCRRAYAGEAVDVTEIDGYGFVYISHFRSFFYVYAYAYGQLIADALYAEYKKDKQFIEKVKIFLKAGGSMSPDDIFKTLGIDTTKPEFFKKGLKKIEDDLEKISKMI